MVTDSGLLKVLLVTGFICLATAVLCPDSSQWNLRTRARCNSSLPSYNCLYDDSTSSFVEFCTRTPDFQRPGYKFIIRGNIDGIECEKKRYQPIKFWTNGSYHCLLEKTACNGQGQVIHDEGNSTSDRTCRCDYTRGFSFVTRPKQDCFCHPAHEDCSCFIKPCSKFQVMTPDYKCIKASDWNGIFECPVITKTITTTATPQKTTRCPTEKSDLNKSFVRAMVSKKQNVLTVTALIGSAILIIIAFWRRKWITKCCSYLFVPDIDNKMDKKLQDRTLFQMKLKANFKEIVTTIYSNEIVDKLYLSDSETQSVRSCLGRIKQNKALLELVWNRGPVVYKEFIRVLSKIYPELADKIDKTKVSEYQEEVAEELEKMYNEKIPENIRRFHDNQLKNWISEDKTLVKTNASSKILKLVKEKNCVFIAGRPGSGKSSILRHVALQFVEHNESEDYDIIPVVIEPSNILQYYNESRNQIFILDDFCGKDKVNNQLLDVWKLDIEKVLNIIKQNDSVEHDLFFMEVRKPKTKILISSNLSVYFNKLFKPLKTHFEKFFFDLSKVQMTQEERERMMKKYAPDAQVKDLKYDNSQIKFDFPLLCKLSKGKDMDDIRQLFSDPLTTIKADLKKLKTGDNLQFCAVALCTLLNNKFKAQWLNINNETNDIQVRNAVRELCLEFNLDLTNSTDLKIIQKRVGEEMDWLSESDDIFHHIHDEIFNIAAVLCGKSYQRCFINHANSSFIVKRFNFCEEHSDGLINLIAKNRKLYFDRLFKDLENGITYSMFQNIQLKTESYRKTFIEYCEKRELKFKEILGNLKTTAEEDNPSSKILEGKKVKHFLPRQNTFIVLEPPLIDCALQGYEDMVDLLLRMNCDVNERDIYGRSALFVASAKGHIKTVERLVKNKNENREENIENEENKTNEVDIDLSNNINRTPLHVVCKEGQHHIAEYLIQNGADIFACDAGGYSPLHMACEYGNINIIKLLLDTYKEKEKEIEIEKNDNLGQTPIILASSKGENEIVELLIGHKANIKAADKRGLTSLLAASMNGFSTTANVLIQKEANIFHVDNDGRTALFIACEKGHKKIVKMLIDINKEIISICDWHNKSPFYIACAEGRLTIANMLFDGGADINLLDEDVKSPIYAACQRGHEKIVEFLLQNDAKVDTSDIHGNLPLHIACKGGYLNIVQLLLQNHTNSITVPNQWDEKAIDVAQKQGHKDIVCYLNEHESKLNNTNMEIPLVVTINS